MVKNRKIIERDSIKKRIFLINDLNDQGNIIKIRQPDIAELGSLYLTLLANLQKHSKIGKSYRY